MKKVAKKQRNPLKVKKSTKVGKGLKSSQWAIVPLDYPMSETFLGAEDFNEETPALYFRWSNIEGVAHKYGIELYHWDEDLNETTWRLNVEVPEPIAKMIVERLIDDKITEFEELGFERY